jgi:cytoskeletal protein RodZ
MDPKIIGGVLVALVVIGVLLWKFVFKSSGGEPEISFEEGPPVTATPADPVDDAIMGEGGETVPEDETTTLDSAPADDVGEEEAAAQEDAQDEPEGYRIQ